MRWHDLITLRLCQIWIDTNDVVGSRSGYHNQRYSIVLFSLSFLDILFSLSRRKCWDFFLCIRLQRCSCQFLKNAYYFCLCFCFFDKVLFFFSFVKFNVEEYRHDRSSCKVIQSLSFYRSCSFLIMKMYNS